MLFLTDPNGKSPVGKAASGPQDTPESMSLSADAVILLPVRNTVLFPGIVAPITIGRPKSIAAVQQAVREERPIGIVMQRDAEVADPGPNDLFRIGTIANIVRYMTAPDGSHHVVCQGVQRMRILDFLPGTPILAARVLHLPEARGTRAGDRGPLSPPAEPGGRGVAAPAPGAAGTDRGRSGRDLAGATC